MYFKRINVNKHKETAVSFREDSFFVSFGTADHFNKDGISQVAVIPNQILTRQF